jgi:hypothetical protein
VTQGEASLAIPTLGEGMLSPRRHLSAAEAPVTESRGERPNWQERMGLTLAEALRLPGLAETEVVAGGGGLDRVVRYMVVDDPADPLALAGPDVLVVLGARLPPADAANCRALVERLDSMGTAALAYRQAEGPPPMPADVLTEAERRALPVLALPATVRMGEVVSEVLGAVVEKQSEALALSNRMHDQFIDVALSGGGLAEVTEQLAVSLEGAAVLGLGPDREIVTSAGPDGDVAEISDWLWLLDAEAEDEMAMMAPSPGAGRCSSAPARCSSGRRWCRRCRSSASRRCTRWNCASRATWCAGWSPGRCGTPSGRWPRPAPSAGGWTARSPSW